MDFSVLSPDFKDQLEQQRDRLSSERDAIVQAAVQQATATIDANLAHINALLGYSTRSSPVEPLFVQASTKAKPKKVTAEPKIEPKATRQKRILKSDKMAQEAIVPKIITKKKEKPAKASVSKASKASKASKVKPEEFNFAPPVKAEFKTLKLAEAVHIIFQQEPSRLFSVDHIIDELYGPIDEDLMGKSRQRIGVSLGHCLRRKEIVRVQDEPAIYQLNL